jgi:hypothetical protein
MASFSVSDSPWSGRDWTLIQNGFVHLYWKPEILDETLAWLVGEGYEVITLDASSWRSVSDLHRDVASAFEFPSYYGRNLDALNDCLSDVARFEYGAHESATGTVLVARGFGSFVALDRRSAEALTDIFADQARVGALIGHRMLFLIQTNDPDLQLPKVGACQVSWNPAEWLDSKRHPTN